MPHLLSLIAECRYCGNQVTGLKVSRYKEELTCQNANKGLSEMDITTTANRYVVLTSCKTNSGKWVCEAISRV